MRIPVYLAVAQWALLLALGLLVITAYRQLGRVLGRSRQPAELGPPVGSRPGPVAYQRMSRPADPGSGGSRPADPGSGGTRPADLGSASSGSASSGSGGTGSGGTGSGGTGSGGTGSGGPADDAVRSFVPGDGQAALVAFVDPTCPSCEQLVTALGAARDAGELGGLRVLLLTSDPPSYLQISAAFRATRLEIGRPLDRDDLEPYRASATPLLVAIDAAGVVRAAGTVIRLAEVRAYGQACLLAAPGRLLPVTG